jgi:hypothetical protein
LVTGFGAMIARVNPIAGHDLSATDAAQIRPVNGPVKSLFISKERMMLAHRFALAVATISTMAAATLSPTSAFAGRGAFDGNWSVQIATLRGACPSDVGFAVDVRDGVVSAAGLLNVDGKVAANGVTRVRIASGNQSASGTGRLNGNSGSGKWQGVGWQGMCAGRWSANRR